MSQVRFCVWVLVSASAGAQQFTGGVRGAVRDPNGVIPGVTVTLTNEATNVSRETVTNEVGQHNFPGRAARHLYPQGPDFRLQAARVQGPRTSARSSSSRWT